MIYDPSNPMVQLCVKGLETEMSGDREKAAALYHEALQLAANDLEYATSAHYLARVQTNSVEALRWNLLALKYGEKLEGEEAAALLPSLYLNVAKSYEDLGSLQQSRNYYLLADKCKDHLPEDGYGNMIRKGIGAGLERMKSSRSIGNKI